MLRINRTGPGGLRCSSFLVLHLVREFLGPQLQAECPPLSPALWQCIINWRWHIEIVVLKEGRIHNKKGRTSQREGKQEAKNHKCFFSLQEIILFHTLVSHTPQHGMNVLTYSPEYISVEIRSKTHVNVADLKQTRCGCEH